MRAVTGAAQLVTMVRSALRTACQEAASEGPGNIRRTQPLARPCSVRIAIIRRVGEIAGRTGRRRPGDLPEDDGQGPGEGWFYAQAMVPLSWKPLGNGEPAGYDALKPTFAVPP